MSPETGRQDVRQDARRPRSVYQVGDEPDPRFSLANERTALAWVRTSLAMVAGGVGLTSVARLVGLTRWVDLIAGVMCLLGAWLAISAVLGWRRKELALRTGRELPAPVALPWLAAAIFLAGCVLAAVVFAAGRAG